MNDRHAQLNHLRSLLEKKMVPCPMCGYKLPATADPECPQCAQADLSSGVPRVDAVTVAAAIVIVLAIVWVGVIIYSFFYFDPRAAGGVVVPMGAVGTVAFVLYTAPIRVRRLRSRVKRTALFVLSGAAAFLGVVLILLYVAGLGR